LAPDASGDLLIYEGQLELRGKVLIDATLGRSGVDEGQHILHRRDRLLRGIRSRRKSRAGLSKCGRVKADVHLDRGTEEDQRVCWRQGWRRTGKSSGEPALNDWQRWAPDGT
jgi:hypothetical protein